MAPKKTNGDKKTKGAEKKGAPADNSKEVTKARGSGSRFDRETYSVQGKSGLKPATAVNVRHILCEKHSKAMEALNKLQVRSIISASQVGD